MVFANHCLLKSSLTPRDRELVILRAGETSHFEYEWAQHNRIGLEAGLSQGSTVSKKAATPPAGAIPKKPCLSPSTKSDKKNLSDTNWKALAAHYNEQQILDIIFTASNYALLAMALNTLGVEVDDGV